MMVSWTAATDPDTRSSARAARSLESDRSKRCVCHSLHEPADDRSRSSDSRSMDCFLLVNRGSHFARHIIRDRALELVHVGCRGGGRGLVRNDGTLGGLDSNAHVLRLKVWSQVGCDQYPPLQVLDRTGIAQMSVAILVWDLA